MRERPELQPLGVDRAPPRASPRSRARPLCQARRTVATPPATLDDLFTRRLRPLPRARGDHQQRPCPPHHAAHRRPSAARPPILPACVSELPTHSTASYGPPSQRLPPPPTSAPHATRTRARDHLRRGVRRAGRRTPAGPARPRASPCRTRSRAPARAARAPPSTSLERRSAALRWRAAPPGTRKSETSASAVYTAPTLACRLPRGRCRRGRDLLLVQPRAARRRRRRPQAS